MCRTHSWSSHCTQLMPTTSSNRRLLASTSLNLTQTIVSNVVNSSPLVTTQLKCLKSSCNRQLMSPNSLNIRQMCRTHSSRRILLYSCLLLSPIVIKSCNVVQYVSNSTRFVFICPNSSHVNHKPFERKCLRLTQMPQVVLKCLNMSQSVSSRLKHALNCPNFPITSR